MTGFGSADGTVGALRVAVELRSVNHRFFNPSIKLPPSLSRFEPDVRDVLRRSIARGHVTLTGRADAAASADLAIDEARLGAYIERLRELKTRYVLEGPIDLATVLRLPSVISGEDDGHSGTAAELVAIVERAVRAFSASRETEGARLESFLGERLSRIDAAVARLSERAPHRLVEQRDRLRAAVAELAAGVQLDEQRVAQEVAVLADRLDVHEELQRLHSHLAAFRETMAQGGGDGIGKRLGFLLQEMLREANTTGSKANDAAMIQEVVVIKEELERIREQVENLE